MPTGGSVSESEIDALPDPDMFRDAFFLSKHGRWSATELDAMDRDLYALIRKFQTPTKKR